MNENVHRKSQLPITADMGWEQMQQLLDQHLPVKEQVNQRRLIRSYYAHAIILFVLLLTSLSLREVHITEVVSTVETPLTTNKNGVVIEVNHLVRQHKNAVLKPTLSSLISYNEIQHNDQLKKNLDVLPPGPNTVNNEPIVKGKTNDKAEENLADTLISKLSVGKKEAKKDDPQKLVVFETKPKARHKLRFYAGIGSNVSSAIKAQDLHPYPVAEANYSLTRRLYVSAGLSLFAPVTTNADAKSKSVYINDTANNIKMYNEKITYSRLHYMDVPVSLGVNITNRVSFRAGVQVSLLLKERKNKSIEQYDFQMNTVDVPRYSTFATLPANPPAEYEMKVQKIDYRFTAGVKYNIRKFSAGVTYQQGISPVIMKNNNDKKKNHVFALSLLYKIK